MLRGLPPDEGISVLAETRTDRLPVAVSYWTMSSPPVLASVLGTSFEGSTVVYSAPSCSQRAGPKWAEANSFLFIIPSSVAVNCGESWAEARPVSEARTTRNEALYARKVSIRWAVLSLWAKFSGRDT